MRRALKPSTKKDARSYLYRHVTSWKTMFSDPSSREKIYRYSYVPSRPVVKKCTWNLVHIYFRSVLSVFLFTTLLLPSRPVDNLYPQSVPSRPAQTTILCPHFPVSSSCFSPDKANQNRIPPGTAVLFVVLSRLRYAFVATINTALINPFSSCCGD